jgi:hypothetical protein
MEVQIIQMPAVTLVRAANRSYAFFFLRSEHKMITHQANNWVLWLQLFGWATRVNEEYSRSWNNKQEFRIHQLSTQKQIFRLADRAVPQRPSCVKAVWLAGRASKPYLQQFSSLITPIILCQWCYAHYNYSQSCDSASPQRLGCTVEEEFSCFLGTGVFVTVFTELRHWIVVLLGAIWIQSICSHPIYYICILGLPY